MLRHTTRISSNHIVDGFHHLLFIVFKVTVLWQTQQGRSLKSFLYLLTNDYDVLSQKCLITTP